MKRKRDIELVDGVTFELRPLVRHPSKPDWICLRKTPLMVERYRELAPEIQGRNVVEVGVDQGGGTSYFAKLFQPKKLLAIELSEEPVKTLVDFLEQHDKEERISVHWGVDQSDCVTVSRLADETFDDQSLDLVVDDASHLYEPSRATFETLFPRVRPGGTYIIEDWMIDHAFEQRLAEKIAADPGGKVFQTLASADPDETPPLSLLICQLQVASARHPEWISGIRTFRDFCEVRRGNATIEPGTPMEDYVGVLGQAIFAKK